MQENTLCTEINRQTINLIGTEIKYSFVLNPKVSFISISSIFSFTTNQKLYVK